jgi:hypothetical protein
LEEEEEEEDSLPDGDDAAAEEVSSSSNSSSMLHSIHGSTGSSGRCCCSSGKDRAKHTCYKCLPRTSAAAMAHMLCIAAMSYMLHVCLPNPLPPCNKQEGGAGGDEEEEKEEKEERLVAYDSDFVDDEEVDRVHGKARKKTKHSGFFVNDVS